MVRLLERRIPHRQQPVADVVDDDAGRFHDPGCQVLHHVLNQLAREPWCDFLRDSRETADVGEEHGHLAVAAVKKRRVVVERGGQVGREELLELNPPACRLRLALLPGEPGRHGRGHHLRQLGLDRADLQRTAGAPPGAVNGADHFLRIIQNRRGDHGRHSQQAHRARRDLVALIKRAALADDRLQDRVG